jgi:hypothetical protein
VAVVTFFPGRKRTWKDQSLVGGRKLPRLDCPVE